jgi:carboxyl-terminal processing protease
MRVRPFLQPLAIACTVFVLCGFSAQAKEGQDDVSTYELLNLFGDVFDKVRNDYVEPVKDRELIEAALNGMLSSLDPHSGYLNLKAFKEMQVQTRGEFGGLGIEVTMENGLVRVVTPIDETPAARADMRPGDFISAIDETQVLGLSLSEAVEKMRGKPGSKIELTVLREGEKEALKKEITREIIKIRSVRSRAEDDVAYIRVTSFSENTSDHVKEHFEKLKKEIGDKTLKGVVLDLRNNPGGLLDQAIELADHFLEQGEIVSTRSRDLRESRRYAATKGDITEGLPIVVLINEGSASASEIVAGALKDQKRAVVLGVKSFGKGSVQTVLPVQDHGAIRLTTARYYTPSGDAIQAKGITPDIVVQQAKVELIEGTRNISEATLRGHLSNDQDKDAEKNTQAGRKSTLSAQDDYQLSRAIDLIRAVSVYDRLSHLNTHLLAQE